jgi:hypothetical protein
MYISSDLAYIYHISIIDYLQDYNFDKKMENFLKRVWRGPKAEISAVNPRRYGRRFKEFMEGEVIIYENKRKDSQMSETSERSKELEDLTSLVVTEYQ